VISCSVETRDGATPLLSALISRLSNLTPLNAALGGRLERELQDHFSRRESEPNQMGAAKTHFWAGVRSATQLTRVDATGATVTIAHAAILQKVHGGTIRPRERKALAIPAIAQAYGTSPAEIGDGVHFRPARAEASGGKSVGALVDDAGTVWFWLVRSVTQPPDPRALPVQASIMAALEQQAGRFASLLGRGTSAG